jgi:hypothetical protein
MLDFRYFTDVRVLVVTDTNQGRQEDERRELQRRDAIDDVIAGMSEDSPSKVRDKKEARRKEDQRREAWQRSHGQRHVAFVRTRPSHSLSEHQAVAAPQLTSSGANTSESSGTRLLSAPSLRSASVGQNSDDSRRPRDV